MKCLFVGMLGALFVIMLTGYTYSLYSDYQARAETEGIIIGLETLKNSIEPDIIKKNSLIGTNINNMNRFIDKKHMAFLYVTNTGEIIVKGKDSGQVFILLPLLNENHKVSWTCIGGSNKDMPSFCLNSPANNSSLDRHNIQF